MTYVKYRGAKTGIYLISNIVNGKFYIGSTTCDKRRWYAHKRQLTLGTHNNEYLQRAWNKYGEENFVFELMAEYPNEDLLLVEDCLLGYWFGKKECYNLNRSAVMPGLGRVKTAEEKAKIGARFKGRKLSEEHIAKLRLCRWSDETRKLRKGLTFSEESRQKMSIAALNKPPMSIETRKKIGEAHKDVKFSISRCSNISNSKMGHCVSESTKEKIRIARKHQIAKKNSISDETIQEMRIMFATGKYTKKAIAGLFNISQAHAGSILRNLSRKQQV